MRKIGVLCVGKLKESHWREAEEEFLKRLSALARMDVEEVAAEASTATRTPDQTIMTEGARLLDRLEDRPGTVIALDPTGATMTSEGFADLLAGVTDGGRPVTFVIGGTEGLSSDVYERAAHRVSLSRMTFTHEMARVILLEQLYRAEMILHGRPYHR